MSITWPDDVYAILTPDRFHPPVPAGHSPFPSSAGGAGRPRMNRR